MTHEADSEEMDARIDALTHAKAKVRIQNLEDELAHEKQMYAEAVKNSEKLEELLSPVAEGTHVIVPVEPTEAILRAGVNYAPHEPPNALPTMQLLVYAMYKSIMLSASKETD